MSTLTGILPTAVANGATPTTAASSNAFNSLSPSDFVQMMVTQLQNQDPMDPTNSQDILSQMSSIGQLESSDQLQTSLTSMTLQNQISSASSLIGKSVQGLDANNNQTTGNVKSISIQQTPASQSSTGVATSNVILNLDNNDSLPLGNVTSISTPTATAAPSALTAAAAAVQAAAAGAVNQTANLAASAIAPIVSIAPN
jgi:flagellar basal-body rod modification protein FlgD